MRQSIIAYLTKKYDRLGDRLLQFEQILQGEKRHVIFAFRLLFARLHQNLLEFLIVVVADPGESFKILKKRDERAVSTISFVEYRLYTRKLKLFSIGGISTVVFATLMISLVVNFVMPNLSTLAATYNFVQTDWSGGADGGTYPVDPGNRTGWTKYNSTDDTVATSTAGTLTVTNSANIYQTSDTDFSSGANMSFSQISGTGASASVAQTIAE